jgi:hypothetical protein
METLIVDAMSVLCLISLQDQVLNIAQIVRHGWDTRRFYGWRRWCLGNVLGVIS